MLFLYFFRSIFSICDLRFWAPRVLKLLLRRDDPQTARNGELRYQIRFLAVAIGAPVRNRSCDYVIHQ